MNITLKPNNTSIIQYHLYKNTFDNTYVIVTDELKDLFERTLTNMGSAPINVGSSYHISELQFKAIELGIEADVIVDLNYN